MSGYRQFCPIAKGAEVVGTRWTALVLRELMCDERTFNSIHRGVPLMSRTLLAERLRGLEADGIVVRRPLRGGGYGYALSPSGHALRDVIDAIGRWGLIYGRDRIEPGDRDSGVLMWALRRRVNRELLPARRVVVRFNLSGVARSRTGVRLHWLVMERSGADACTKDPGFPVDVTLSGDVAHLIAVYLGHATWQEATRRHLRLTGDRTVIQNLERWLQLDRLVGRDLPILPPAPARQSGGRVGRIAS
jgi:DNA-binding HxlR family transcriptional regulator